MINFKKSYQLQPSFVVGEMQTTAPSQLAAALAFECLNKSEELFELMLAKD